MHIFLMLKFYKAITPRFSSFRICYHFDLLDWPVGFEFSAQLGFACVVVDASNKQRSKGICGGLSVTLRVPQSNSLFQFVRHLFFFFPLFPLHPTQKKGIISTLNHVKKQICICTKSTNIFNEIQTCTLKPTLCCMFLPLYKDCYFDS